MKLISFQEEMSQMTTKAAYAEATLLPVMVCKSSFVTYIRTKAQWPFLCNEEQTKLHAWLYNLQYTFKCTRS